MPRLRFQTGCLQLFLSHNARTINLIYSFGRQSKLLNCDGKTNSNAGCSVAFPDGLNYGPSYGPPFNDNGGGWYVMHNNQFQPMSSTCFPLLPGLL